MAHTDHANIMQRLLFIFNTFFKLNNSFDWCILENMNNEQRFKEKSLVLSHTETFN